MTFLKGGGGTADNSALLIAYRFISTLTTGGPGSIPTRVMGFFQPNLLCFDLCYDFRVVRLVIFETPRSNRMMAAILNHGPERRILNQSAEGTKMIYCFRNV